MDIKAIDEEIRYENRDVRVMYLMNLLILLVAISITALSFGHLTVPIGKGAQHLLGRTHATLSFFQVLPWSVVVIFFVMLSIIEIRRISNTKVKLRPSSVVINGEIIDFNRIKSVRSHYANGRNIGLGKFIDLRYGDRKITIAIIDPDKFMRDIRECMVEQGINLKDRVFYFHSGDAQPWKIEVLGMSSEAKEPTGRLIPLYPGEFIEVLLGYWLIVGVLLLPVIFQKIDLTESFQIILMLNPPLITLLTWRYLLSIEPGYRGREGFIFGLFLSLMTFLATITLIFLFFKGNFAILKNYLTWIFYLETIVFPTVIGYLKW